jgi:hypothetical protein
LIGCSDIRDVFSKDDFPEYRMADPEPPKSKYQCLVDAVTDAGLASKLPPIMPGTEVEERKASGNQLLPPLLDGANFSYQGVDGGNHIIQGEVNLAQNYDNPTTQLFLHKGFSILSEPDNDKYSFHAEVITFKNMETGVETVQEGTPAKQGTVAETADKIIKCRTPPMS